MAQAQDGEGSKAIQPFPNIIQAGSSPFNQIL